MRSKNITKNNIEKRTKPKPGTQSEVMPGKTFPEEKNCCRFI